MISFIKSGFRAEDIRSNTLKYYEMFGIDGFSEMDVLWVLNWAEALVKLRIKIEDKPETNLFRFEVNDSYIAYTST